MYEHTLYNGENMMISIDGEINGEIMSINWKKDLDDPGDYPVTGEIRCVLFATEPLRKYIRSYGHSTIDIVFWSDGYNDRNGDTKDHRKMQFSQYGAFTISYVKLTEQSQGMDLQGRGMYITYKFKARDAIHLPEYSANPVDQDRLLSVDYRDMSDLSLTDLCLKYLYERENKWRFHDGHQPTRDEAATRFDEKDEVYL